MPGYWLFADMELQGRPGHVVRHPSASLNDLNSATASGPRRQGLGLGLNDEASEASRFTMVLRITTWNVNGIRNPFGYQPWRSARTFEAMFDILEADIVIMQELKIQRKDLRDDMVLVPGWDCYFSLPKHKKGEHTDESMISKHLS